MPVAKHAPKTLTPEQVQRLLDACLHLRDRFLLALLYETGMRVGQALGLRHEDFVSRERLVRIVARRSLRPMARPGRPEIQLFRRRLTGTRRPVIERRRRMASRRSGPYIAARPFEASQATTFDVNVAIVRCATKAWPLSS